ncbi:T9SS type A sorting domain-containing protein [Winogradskyella sp. R77965]|uniref:T9SS type A sorting domain-containing protein n=1 Tax=Winogradskyella sp. R77965 TaxID=3093872 RepID=UPI0037DC40B8
MKTKLLYLLFVIPLMALGQSIRSEDFNGLTAGNISGQGSWMTFIDPGTGTSTNISEASLQITANGNNASNGFTLTGPNGDGGGVFAWNDGFSASWTARTSGNDIVEVEFSINPGDTGSASQNDFGVYIYTADFSKILAGVSIDASTNEISLVAYSQPTGEPAPDNFIYGLGSLIIPSNTFSTFGISYNTITGEVLIDGEIITDGPLALSTNTATDTPAEVDFFAFSGSTAASSNTTSETMIFDDFIVRASATNTLLSTEEFVSGITSIFPNPANDIITLKSNYMIENVKFINSLGQTVLEMSNNLKQEIQFDISKLNSGIYFMNITSTDAKTETRKFIKN